MEKKQIEEKIKKVFQDAIENKAFELAMAEVKTMELLPESITKGLKDNYVVRPFALAGFIAGIRFMLNNQAEEDDLPFA